jgi:predicted metalloendopeptidase
MQLGLRTKQLLTVLALMGLSAVAVRSASNSREDEMDSSIKPGDDFYRYANGGWLKANKMPNGQSSYDNRALMAERTNQQVRDLIQNAAFAHAAQSSVVQKVGDYYASFLDQDSIEAKGLSPLADEMARIAAITDNTSLSAYLGTTLNSEVEGLTANAYHIFGR